MRERRINILFVIFISRYTDSKSEGYNYEG